MDSTTKRAFVWKTQTGESIPVTSMQTTHLFFVVRMIFNHTVPEADQIPGCKRYDGPSDWAPSTRAKMMAVMVLELRNRPRNDLQPWMWVQLAYMADVMRRLCRRQVANN